MSTALLVALFAAMVLARCAGDTPNPTIHGASATHDTVPAHEDRSLDSWVLTKADSPMVATPLTEVIYRAPAFDTLSAHQLDLRGYMAIGIYAEPVEAPSPSHVQRFVDRLHSAEMADLYAYEYRPWLDPDRTNRLVFSDSLTLLESTRALAEQIDSIVTSTEEIAE